MISIYYDSQLVGLCLKYKLIEPQSVNKYNRSKSLLLIKGSTKVKTETYGQSKLKLKHNITIKIINIRMQTFSKNSLSYVKNQNNPPRGIRQRLSQPVTK